MNYQDLLKSSEKVAQTDKIEVRRMGGVVYKIFDKSFSCSGIFYEAMLQTRAKEAGVVVPVIRGVEEVDERTAIVSDFVSGSTIRTLMEENPGKRDEYLALLAELQVNIHACTVFDVKKLKHRLMEDIKTVSYIDDIKKYELMTRLASMPEHNKLCHGNYGPENVVIDDMGHPVILDWVAATRGNASADAARTYLKLSLDSSEDAEKYLSIFCEKTGTAKNYVQEWLPIVAASCLNDKKLGEKEKTVMLTWLDVVDYE